MKKTIMIVLFIVFGVLAAASYVSSGGDCYHCHQAFSNCITGCGDNGRCQGACHQEFSNCTSRCQ